MPEPGGNRTIVLRIVSDVLEVPGVTAADSFYDFGGSSLQAMRICARIGRELGIEIPAQVLFDSDTLADVISMTEA
ncbi:acyl carrier protein [Micromonospora sp. NBC_00421]|uniref:acyl carrier protein n=1 Tax=Micromonospora sp. NBC_00421 TaxID=2975976 RepID=UPI002E1AF0A9